MYVLYVLYVLVCTGASPPGAGDRARRRPSKGSAIAADTIDAAVGGRKPSTPAPGLTLQDLPYYEA